MKKILAVLLAVVIALSCAVVGFAADSDLSAFSQTRKPTMVRYYDKTMTEDKTVDHSQAKYAYLYWSDVSASNPVIYNGVTYTEINDEQSGSLRIRVTAKIAEQWIDDDLDIPVVPLPSTFEANFIVIIDGSLTTLSQFSQVKDVAKTFISQFYEGPNISTCLFDVIEFGGDDFENPYAIQLTDGFVPAKTAIAETNVALNFAKVDALGWTSSRLNKALEKARSEAFIQNQIDGKDVYVICITDGLVCDYADTVASSTFGALGFNLDGNRASSATVIGNCNDEFESLKNKGFKVATIALGSTTKKSDAFSYNAYEFLNRAASESASGFKYYINADAYDKNNKAQAAKDLASEIINGKKVGKKAVPTAETITREEKKQEKTDEVKGIFLLLFTFLGKVFSLFKIFFA